MNERTNDNSDKIDWHNYFKKRFNTHTTFQKYIAWEWQHEMPLFKLIIRHFDIGSKIIECGCGTGIFSSILNRAGYKLTCIDIDTKMLDLARKMSKKLGATVTFKKADLFQLGKYHNKFDLAYSNGVLEHFKTKDERVNALKEQAKVADYVLTKVPTFLIREDFDGYMYPYTIMRLRKEFKKSGIKIINETSVGGEKNILFRTFDACTPPIISKHIRPYLGPSIVILGQTKHNT